MHEFGLVDEFIHQLVESYNHGIEQRFKVVRISYGPGLVEDSLRQAFQVHTAGTLLEKVRFEFVKKIVQILCQCGCVQREGLEQADIGFVVCSECHHICTIPNFNVLELIDAS